jgi:GNAT superfamily N-acetyltransferase
MPGAATLGLFEVETDTTSDAIARLLVVSAGEWARRHGCTEILAPVDVNTWFSYRFVLPSGDARSEPAPYAWEPVQPAEYPALLGRLGFTEFERYATLGGRLPECEGSGASDTTCATEDAFEHALDAGYRFVGLDATTDLGCLLDELHPLCMAAFRDNLLFEPLSKDHFRALFTGSIAASDCTLSQCVRDREGRLAGFALVLADRGTVAVKTIAIAPKHRGRRLSTALVHLVLRRATALGHRQFVAALVRRGNRSESLALPCLAAASDQWRREYVLLRCELETP